MLENEISNSLFCLYQTEKNSLKMQVENLTRELSTTGDLHTQLTAKVHDLEKENLVLKNRADEVRTVTTNIVFIRMHYALLTTSLVALHQNPNNSV